ncbi:hypothetical protein TCAL_05620 [Tigriopus californicus]|uniref:Ionotropic glutamate receptor C-terminal domain-containing protein n=1 Tax=Tigriopus californicus TaxID=6832 RepID=A0A553NVJ8_TIGCA|nr:hypothetical protein TCAL_05620 [Tigriopus californicus]
MNVLDLILKMCIVLQSTVAFKRRGGGIDVSTHSKTDRNLHVHLHFPTQSPDKVPSISSHNDVHESHFHSNSSNTLGVENDLYKPWLRVGIVLPRHFFRQRLYQSVISRSQSAMAQISYRNEKNSLLAKIKQEFQFEWSSRLDNETDSINFGDLEVAPPPSDITNLLCHHFSNGSAAIIYFTNTEKFGRSTAASQYFLQMAGFLGIPVLAWNADNTGIEKGSVASGSESTTNHLQLAPGINHQVAALLSILDRYGWEQFGIVTSEIAGHDDFVQAVRDQISEGKYKKSKYVVQDMFKVTESNGWSFKEIAQSEARIFLLYCTQAEASILMEQADKYGLVSSKYLWLVTQSVVGNPSDRSFNRRVLPVGMLGVHFEVDLEEVLESFLTKAMEVFFTGVLDMHEKGRKDLDFSLDCQGGGNSGEHRWATGTQFYKFLQNVSRPEYDRSKMDSPNMFEVDGSIAYAELRVVNFKPSSKFDSFAGFWDEVGTWDSNKGLDIKDIVWPGGSHLPPEGVPEKFHVRITFLEEPPFIIVSDPDPISAKCSMNRGVPCEVPVTPEMKEYGNMSSVGKCCSGLCIDLLRKFEDDLGFTYDLTRVADTRWGTLENGKWNGLMRELVEKKTDLVLSALKVSAEREAAVDFTIPFLEAGIAILVAKRTGIISPTAFLEPFDSSSWMLVVPSKSEHRFSLFRTYWLVWSVLFQASVHKDCPRGLTARFMSSVWALFAVVFLALYTANLAAFMIPRKEFHDFKGIDDVRISNPLSQKPMLKYSTIPYSYSEVTLQNHHPTVFNYMKHFNVVYNTTKKAIKAVKDGSLDAFIYDGMVLNYIASQDEECRLLQVGSWAAMTGYAIAFPSHSKYKNMFNEKILELRENGDLERLSRFWMSGMCKPNEQEKRASEPLTVSQFLSAFFLLGIGTIISVLLLLLEHIYMKYFQDSLLDKPKTAQLCSLISLSVGHRFVRSKSLSQGLPSRISTAINGDSINGASPFGHHWQHSCGSRTCSSTLHQLEEELEDALIQINHLEDQIKQVEAIDCLKNGGQKKNLENDRSTESLANATDTAEDLILSQMSGEEDDEDESVGFLDEDGIQESLCTSDTPRSIGMGSGVSDSNLLKPLRGQVVTKETVL